MLRLAKDHCIVLKGFYLTEQAGTPALPVSRGFIAGRGSELYALRRRSATSGSDLSKARDR
jgi:hypothetical protein